MTTRKRTRRETTYKNSDVECVSKQMTLLPMNDNQGLYIEALKSHDQIIVCGYSGTGKTYIAATYAANLYLTKQIDKIIVTRPNISVGKDIGFFPGTLEEKMAPWAAPVMDVLQKQLGKGVVETAVKSGNIEIAPLSTMRGRSFEDSFIILDEASNTNVQEIMMFLTRMGQNTHVVINGDVRQSDLKDVHHNGLTKAIHLVKKYNMDVPVIEFEIDDIVRSGRTKDWVIAFTQEGLM